jgi:uncharacterized protein
MDTVIYNLSFLAIALGVAIAFKLVDKRLTLAFCLLFSIYLALDDLATTLPNVFSLLHVFPGQWNWSGKVYSILLSIVVILGFGMKAQAVGLTLPKTNITIGVIALVPLTLVGVVLGHFFDPDPPTAETLAFQASMPSLAEELAYRGVAPALLLGLVHRRLPPERVPWAVVCAAAIPFGVWHGLAFSSGAFSFDWVPAVYTFIGGVVYGWLRFSTGSLLFPVLAHSFANVAFHLMALT